MLNFYKLKKFTLVEEIEYISQEFKTKFDAKSNKTQIYFFRKINLNKYIFYDSYTTDIVDYNRIFVS